VSTAAQSGVSASGRKWTFDKRDVTPRRLVGRVVGRAEVMRMPEPPLFEGCDERLEDSSDAWGRGQV